MACAAGAIDNSAYIAAATAQADSITSEATVWAAIQVALLVWQRWTKGKLTDIQRDQANRRMVIAEEVLAHAQLTWPKEQALVSETMAEGVAQPAYSRAGITVASVDAESNAAYAYYEADTTNKGLPFTACDDNRMARGLAQVRSDMASHTMRSEEARAVVLGDRRFSRQLSVLGLGRGKLRDALTAGQLSGAGATVRNSIIDSINSGMALWGYTNNRWQQRGQWGAAIQDGPAAIPRSGRIYTAGPTADGSYQPTVIEIVQPDNTGGA